MHIVIAGNIGSGKTTLTRLLAKHYGWKPLFEPVDINPYLTDYYKDIPRWAFNTEVFYLKQRFKSMLEIADSSETIVQDRSIFEGVHVFATANREMGNLTERDFDTYMELFDCMLEVVKLPDLMVYLRASVPHLVKNVQKRGRDYEQAIPIEYLQGLNDKYEDFITRKYTGEVLTIEVNDLDFLNNEQHFADIVDKIDHRLFGLFNTSQF